MEKARTSRGDVRPGARSHVFKPKPEFSSRIEAEYGLLTQSALCLRVEIDAALRSGVVPPPKC
jgi:hypothetical protein